MHATNAIKAAKSNVTAIEKIADGQWTYRVWTGRQVWEDGCVPGDYRGTLALRRRSLIALALRAAGMPTHDAQAIAYEYTDESNWQAIVRKFAEKL